MSRLIRERESLGPVNLRADVEMEEIDTRITSMETEKQDLTKPLQNYALPYLHLTEGRARHTASFADVNKYFSELFTSLFEVVTQNYGLQTQMTPFRLDWKF